MKRCVKCNKISKCDHCSLQCLLECEPQAIQFRHFVQKVHSRQKNAEITANDLSILWTKQKGVCPYTKKRMSMPKKGSKLPLQASLDRINPKKGYQTDNVQFVSLAANLAKNDWSHNQIAEIWEN